MQVTIVPRPIRLINHCFTTRTSRTGRTGRTVEVGELSY